METSTHIKATMVARLSKKVRMSWERWLVSLKKKYMLPSWDCEK